MADIAKVNRFMELEGLRGVAAIVVVLYHNLLAFYSLAFLGVYSRFEVVQNMKYEDNLYGNPIMVLLSGQFAVAIFFVLSGFVLSIGFFSTGSIDIVKKLALKRYPRLMLPALASIIIAFIIITLGISHEQQAAAITHSGWLQYWWDFTPNLYNALSSGVREIFFLGGNRYNNALWTMTTEFGGSFIVFGFLALFAKVKYRAVLYALLVLVLFNTWYVAFIVGMGLADLYASGRIAQVKRSWKIIPVVVIGLFLGGYPAGAALGTLYQYITVPGAPIVWKTFYLTIGATILIYAVLTTSQLARVFKIKMVSMLGKYTYSLYLVHLSILYTFTTYVFIGLRQQLHLGYNTSALLSIIMSIPVIILATMLFEEFIDQKSIKLSSYLANILIGERKSLVIEKIVNYRSFIYVKFNAIRSYLKTKVTNEPKADY